VATRFASVLQQQAADKVGKVALRKGLSTARHKQVLVRGIRLEQLGPVSLLQILLQQVDPPPKVVRGQLSAIDSMEARVLELQHPHFPHSSTF
jgi:hypothetical protein